MSYDQQVFKIPKESSDYQECSNFVTQAIESIIKDAIDAGENKIVINTNLKLGLPMENINKIAGPFVEAWASQTFYELCQKKGNKYHLINVEAVERLHMADETCLMDGIMEVVDYNAYDLKYLSPRDISYNPALGTGQIQVRDIHYVEIEPRSTWEFCQLLDKKYLNSARRDFDQWHALASKHGWIKEDV